jgi:hypothetical protein
MEHIYKQGVPEVYIYQVQHYLMITGLKWGYFAFWDYDRWEPYKFRIKADPSLHTEMLRRYKIFWDSVQNGRQRVANGEQVKAPHFDFGDPQDYTFVDDKELDLLLGNYSEVYELKYSTEDRYKETRAAIISYLRPKDKTKTIKTRHHVCTVTKVNRQAYSYYRITVKPREE